MADARDMESDYNQFNNPHDKIKVLAFSPIRPEGRVDEYGNIIPD